MRSDENSVLDGRTSETFARLLSTRVGREARRLAHGTALGGRWTAKTYSGCIPRTMSTASSRPPGGGSRPHLRVDQRRRATSCASQPALAAGPALGALRSNSDPGRPFQCSATALESSFCFLGGACAIPRRATARILPGEQPRRPPRCAGSPRPASARHRSSMPTPARATAPRPSPPATIRSPP